MVSGNLQLIYNYYNIYCRDETIDNNFHNILIHWILISIKIPDNIGHRGFIYKAILANTEKAFDEAIKYGVDYIECDVRMINNELVITHDKPYEHLSLGLKPISFRDWLQKYKDHKEDIGVEYKILNLIKEECKYMKYDIVLQSFSKEAVEILNKNNLIIILKTYLF